MFKFVSLLFVLIVLLITAPVTSLAEIAKNSSAKESSVTAGEPVLQFHTLRLSPGQDLKKEIQSFCQSHKIQAAVIISGVGSLKTANIRYSDAKEGTTLKGPFEIVSLTGTVGLEGLHLHIAVSDAQGNTKGGHLMDGNIIYTTAELVFLEDTHLVFQRKLDPQTSYKELQVETRAK